MKKLFLLSALVLTAAASWAQTRLAIESADVVCGRTVTVPVCLEKTVDVNALQFHFTLPEGLTLEGTPELALEGSAFHLAYKNNDGDHRLVIYNDNNDKFNVESGAPVFNMTLKMAETAGKGTYNLNVTKELLAALDKTGIEASAYNVPIEAYLLGDVNRDGFWTISDVTITIDNMLDDAFQCAADMNDDKAITISDVTSVIEYMLNDGPASVAPIKLAPATRAEGEDEVIIPSVTFDESGVGYLVVSMNNTTVYKGFQMDITIPEGFSFVTKKNGKFEITASEDRMDGFTPYTRLFNENRTLRVGMVSLEGDEIADTEGELIRVKLAAGEGVAYGDYKATITNIRFTHKGNDVPFDDMDVTLTIPEPVAISGVEAQQSNGKAYLLDGRRANSTKKGGLYIIDGKKQVVK